MCPLLLLCMACIHGIHGIHVLHKLFILHFDSKCFGWRYKYFIFGNENTQTAVEGNNKSCVNVATSSSSLFCLSCGRMNIFNLKLIRIFSPQINWVHLPLYCWRKKKKEKKESFPFGLCDISVMIERNMKLRSNKNQLQFCQRKELMWSLFENSVLLSWCANQLAYHEFNDSSIRANFQITSSKWWDSTLNYG